MLTLYHWEPSGDSAKVLICLKEKGIDFESRYVDVLGFEQFDPGYLELSPLGKGPVVVHDGDVFNESKLLCEYLEDAFPEPSLAPGDAAGWYDVQEWIRYVDAQLHDAVNLLGWHLVTAPSLGEAALTSFNERLAAVPVREQAAGWGAVVRDAESTEDQLENARARIREGVQRMETALETSEWLAGSGYSLADICAWGAVRNLPDLMPDTLNESATPKVEAWRRAVASRPAVQAALAMGRRNHPAGSYARA